MNLKQALLNPRPDRLAKIEYQSHFLNIIGVIFVSVVLIIKGYWYAIFAIIFSIGVSFSQGMAARAKYKALAELFPKPKPEDYPKEISLTRRRGFIISYVFGDWMQTVCALISVIIIVLWVHPTKWYHGFIIIVGSLANFFILYYVINYYFAERIYSKRFAKEAKGEKYIKSHT